MGKWGWLATGGKINEAALGLGRKQLDTDLFADLEAFFAADDATINGWP